MSDLPAEQLLLQQELLKKLDGISEPDTLLRFMSEVLRTLLRREGDSDFLTTIQDAFAAGIIGHGWDEQKTLAREVIQVVMDKRPEIARAWQALHGVAAPTPQRRAADVVPAVPSTTPPVPPADPSTAEGMVAEFATHMLHRRIELLRVPPPPPPSIAYSHTQPFFLFTDAFRDLIGGFVAGPLLDQSRLGLERRVYRFVTPEILADQALRKAFITEKQNVIWKILLSRLSKLAAAHGSAEAKQAAALRGSGTTPTYKVVEMPVECPRNYSILGVHFTLGQETVMRQVRVRVPSPNILDSHEQDALDLMAALRARAAEMGLDLPPSADFQFIRTLLDFNTRLFKQARDELLGLGAHAETSATYLRERCKVIDETFNTYLADILPIMLFTSHGDNVFGFAELYAVCIGAARDMSGVGAKRPFIPLEILRRPRELAFQLREALRRRLHMDVVLASVEKLVECWQVMGRKRFATQLDGALTLIGAFPMVFAGDPEEATFTRIGALVREALSGEEINRAALLIQVGQIYDRIGRKANAIA
ncbi:conserved hypothetical protein [Candidatus Terasakiella magnetica]|nr:conserved hypothetical protein [Candidatus Terasakiella magnetica]